MSEEEIVQQVETTQNAEDTPEQKVVTNEVVAADPEEPFFDRKDISSCNISFFFGSGVNGRAFPQLDGFVKTKEFLDKLSPENKGLKLEEQLNKVEDAQREEARNIFKGEVEHFNSIVDKNDKAITHLKEMLKAIHGIVKESENRIELMKQINIFTLNYDFIVEEALTDLGFLSNSISSTNLKNHDKFFNVVGYDFSLKRYIPTFLISHIHGDVSNPIVPGIDKYDETLLQGKFEILFKMKEKLSKTNSALIVIGYSGNDRHLNTILKDCIEAGLSVYWYCYNKDDKDKMPKEFTDKVKAFLGDGETDSTLSCANDLRGLTQWAK